MLGEIEPSTLALSCGTRPGGQGYLDEALAPAQPWRSPTETEFGLLGAEASRQAARIQLVRRLPDWWMAFAGLRHALRHAAGLEEARALTQDARWRALALGFEDALRPAMVDGGHSTAGTGVGVHPPGLPTVTWDPPRSGYIGLHLDSWYGPQTPLERATAPGRISINLGEEDRFFVFCNLPLAAMAHRVRPAGDAERAMDAGTVARDFLRQHPDYPLVRLRVRPGEAYVAPTENICHDGSTEDRTTWDVSLTVRGWFDGVDFDSTAVRPPGSIDPSEMLQRARLR